MKRKSLLRKRSKLSVSSLKRKLDAIFSTYIRVKYSDKNGIARCFTCGISKPWKELQNGHYISRVHNSLRYDEQNCHPQCSACNIFKHGNLDEYALALVKKYGAKILQKLQSEKRKVKQFTVQELEELIVKFRCELNDLEQDFYYDDNLRGVR